MKNPVTMMFLLPGALAALLCAIGCRTTYRSHAVLGRIAPPSLSADRQETVWLPDQVAAYSVGRTVDPRDPNLLHEAHTIYRRERTSRPNPTPPAALVFPPPASPSANDAILILRDALTAELNRQRQASQGLIDQTRALDGQLRQLNSQTEEFRHALQQATRLRDQLTAVSNRLELIEHQLRLHSAPSSSTMAADSSAGLPLLR